MTEASATALLTKSFNEPLTAAEAEALAVWEAAAPENQQVAEELRRGWAAVEPPPFPASIDLEADFAAVLARTSAPAQPATAIVRHLRPSRSRQARPRPRSMIGYAAAAAAVLTLLVLLLPDGKPTLEVVVATTNTESVTLPDGSLVKLKAGSTLQYPSVFPATRRDITLNGEAVFEVVAQPEQPFVVTTQALAVQVLGTVFSVVDGAAPSVSVLEGRVQVGYRNNQLILNAQETASLSETGVLTKTQDDQLNGFGWSRGYVSFDGATLQHVLKVVSTQSGSTISLADTSLANCPVVGRYRVDGPPAQLAEILASTFGMTAKHTSEGYLLTGGSCQ